MQVQASCASMKANKVSVIKLSNASKENYCKRACKYASQVMQMFKFIVRACELVIQASVNIVMLAKYES